VGILEQVRQWIDGETTEHGLEEAARNAQVRPHSETEAFIVRIARSIEETMQREMVTLPQGSVVMPTEYLIFLGTEDDKEWQGVKRRGLEKGLLHILTERAHELARGRKLEASALSIKLRKDPTVARGEFRVVHGWAEDAELQRTQVLKLHDTVDTSAEQESLTTPIADDTESTGSIDQSELNLDFEADIAKRPAESYRLEIWHGGALQNIVPVYKEHLVIGRGLKSRPVDIALVGDIGISRHHMHLHSDVSGRFTLVHEGRNPTVVNGTTLRPGDSVEVQPGIRIEVCSYLLIIKSDR